MKRKILSLAVALCLLVALSVLLSSCGGSGGTAWLSGTDAPTAELSANVGDFYFDEDDCQIYKLTDEGWLLLSEIKGDKGDKGDTGAAGQNGATGIVGPAGAKWFSGTEVTGTEQLNAATVAGARVGDMYFNSETGAVYQCVEMDAWEYLSNTTGAPGQNGAPGVGVEDITIEYDVDNDGREIAVFTIFYSNDTAQIITVLMPLEVASIELASDPVIAVGSTSELKIRVYYEDGSNEIVPVTSDMLDSDGYDIPNNNVVGDYYCHIIYKGMDFYETIYVVDPTDTSVRRIEAASDNVIVYLDGGALALDTLGVKFEATLANFTKTSLSASELDFNTSEYRGEGIPFYLTFNLIANPEIQGSIYVLPVENVQNFHHNGASASMWPSDAFLCPLNGEIVERESSVVTLEIFVDEGHFERKIAVTNDNIVSVEDDTPFNNAAISFGTYKMVGDELCGVDFDGAINVEVYDPEAIILSHFVVGENTFRVGDASLDDIEISLVYQTVNYNYLYVPVTVEEENIIDGEIDFSSYGYYDVVVWVDIDDDGSLDEGEATSILVEIYDPEYCNINNINTGIYIEDPIKVGTSLEDFLAEYIVGQNIDVWYYEDIDGILSESFKIKREWIDTDGIAVDGDGKITSVGRVYVTVFYKIEGQEASIGERIYFELEPDMTGATVLGSYVITGTTTDLEMSMFNTFAVYSNGIAVIDPGFNEGYAECVVTDSVISIDYQGDKYTFTLTSEDYGTLMPGYKKATVYAPAGEGTVYTSSINDGFSNMFDVVVFEDYLVLQLSELAAEGFGVTDKLIFTFKMQLAGGAQYSMMGGSTLITFDHTAKTFVMTMG